MNEVDNRHSFKMANCRSFTPSFNHLCLDDLWRNPSLPHRGSEGFPYLDIPSISLIQAYRHQCDLFPVTYFIHASSGWMRYNCYSPAIELLNIKGVSDNTSRVLWCRVGHYNLL